MEIQLSVQSSWQKYICGINIPKICKNKVFWSSLTLLGFSILLKIFSTELSPEANANF